MADLIKGRPVKFIRKSNNLVEGKYRFDIWEMRIFAKMLTIIQPNDEDFKRYRIYLKDIITEFSIDKNNRSYEELKRGAEKLASREIRIPMLSAEGIEMELFTHIASGVKSFADNSQGKYIEIDFHPDMKPYLLQLQNKFLMYDARNILKLPSSFSIRIYELLKQYEPIGKRKITIEDLKEMLDIQEKYSLYANLKQRVILKAQADLALFTDIRFTFDEIKRGKSVTEIIFYIFKNTDVIDKRGEIFKPIEIDYQITEKDVLATQFYNLVKHYKGSGKGTVEKWVEKYTTEHIMSRINFVRNQIEIGKDIKNPMGLLSKMMLEVSLFDPIQATKDKKEAEKSALKNQERIDEEQKKSEQKAINEIKILQKSKIEEIDILIQKNTNLVGLFLEDLKTQRNTENPSFIVQLAYDNYKTNIDGIIPNSKQEILYNYELGGSFSAYMMDWFEMKFDISKRYL